MRMGSLLANIAEQEDKTGLWTFDWRRMFINMAQGHSEEKLLMACYEAACQGKKYILYNSVLPPPKCLEEHNFFLEKDSKLGTIYRFE